VEGRLQSRNWQDNQGNNRTTIEVIAERVQFLTPKGESQQPPVDLGQEPRAEEPEFAGQESPEIES
jgi:single-strand DNA-binding protein